ncbi:oligosaccharide flippase family protein [Tenacibaculum maritimum]|uniref:oligosaccharide flippase family protein n=1 Tax=Tenacibaculum maritimum TaxID=107401 RepID=UPI0012E6B3DD|nr:oligosaccharide flippase family protein [Tenacibaculum maritimum]MCD9565713.1 oligosaccharide flippase family protein [Tenacibaculum maritimum]MCD9579368.1 oligosaccharide flippase family protein [Tenacibaculum maritimum]MCD9596284.1 oligosaccharide flippase family protein [Tenacibaculum maritimum]MCD9610595.1 oligosaccharide flippase family protein [Tenacibaculum maritimum]MCD9613586.1 oligosaccharide flippase family protein [Tenacibaculum maritimum]
MPFFSFIKKYKSIRANFLYLAIIRFLNITTKFFLVAYLVRVFGEKKFGLLTWFESILQYFIIFVNFGFNIYGAKYIVNYKENNIQLNKIISSIYFIKGSIFVSSFFILIILYFFGTFTTNNTILFILLLSALGDLLFPIWYFQGKENLKALIRTVVLSKGILIVATFCFINNPYKLNLYVYIFTICQILMGVLGFLALKKDANFHFILPEKKILKSVLSTAKFYFLGNVSMLIYNALTVFIIGLYFSMEKVTAFDISLKIIFLCILPFEILQAVVLPTITKSKNKKLLKKMVLISLITGASIYFFLNIFGYNLLFLFGGEEMVKYLSILKKLSFLALTVPATFMLGQCGLVAFGIDKQYNYSLTIVAIIYVIIVFYLIITQTISFNKLLFLRVFSDYLLFSFLIFLAFKNNLFKLSRSLK